ncbi:beta-galactosidase trimerization domain-containing protein [Microbacterium sp. M28]|uniref:beta-galactosidase trimerization domain-containing protein n=1 Tax=Microbacterium sp. M28 TaxID=2962064 RepID=UPI0021F4EC6C|nr:beta-galactosidase trimerization domain-containing protein [Microbacterium sp. M28]UYO97385.1 beta-galactosidase trimerization domain-containing protein [Microbacterium sp. M28]
MTSAIVCAGAVAEVQRSARLPEVTRPGWWNEAFGVFQTNLREIDATLDVEAVLDDIESHGATAWLLNVGGILAHYPSDLDFHTRNPHLADRPGGDLVRDAIDAARRRGIRLLARMDFSKVTPEVIRSHPEWAYRAADGGLQVYEGLVSVCPNGGYYQSAMFEIVDEVIRRYQVDGFFFNWFGFNEVDYGGTRHGPCHCASCRAAFLDATGHALPVDEADPIHRVWKLFAQRTIDALTARISAHIAERCPDSALILGRSADVLFHEANNAIGRPFWPHATSEQVSASRVAQPDKPALVNAVAFFDMPYRMADEQPEMIRQYLVQAVARGANPSTYIMGSTRGIRYDGLAAAAEVTRLVTSNARVYSGLRACSPVALVRPDGLRADGPGHAQARAEFMGWFVAMQETHLPFDVLPAEAIAREPLDRFSVVVLPDIVTLTTEQDAAIEGYIEAGGHVVASGGSGLVGPSGVANWSAAQRVIGTEADDSVMLSSYIQLDDATHVEGSALIPRHGRLYGVQWRGDARQTLPVVERAPFGPPEKAYGHVVSTAAAAATRVAGAGSVTQLAWAVGANYGLFGLTRIREVAVSRVRELLGKAPIEVDAPDQIEVVLGRSSAGLVIHLINHTGWRRNGCGPAVPIRGVRLRVPGAGARAVAESIVIPGALTSANEGADLVLSIAEVRDFEAIVVSGI